MSDNEKYLVRVKRDRKISYSARPNYHIICKNEACESRCSQMSTVSKQQMKPCKQMGVQKTGVKTLGSKIR